MKGTTFSPLALLSDCTAATLGHHFVALRSYTHKVGDFYAHHDESRVVRGSGDASRFVVDCKGGETPYTIRFPNGEAPWFARRWAEFNRVMLNKHQIDSLVKFTELGYLHSTMAREAPRSWAAIQDFWAANKHNSTGREEREAWGIENVYVNHWDTATTLLNLPESIKNLIAEELSISVARWSGVKSELGLTSVFGIRSYHDGSYLVCVLLIFAPHSSFCVLPLRLRSFRPDLLLAAQPCRPSGCACAQHDHPC
jgi:hypothetical protein